MAIINTVKILYRKCVTTAPLLLTWVRFPGFIGWMALSFGIAVGTVFPSTACFSTLFYNEIVSVSIFISLLIACCSSSLPLRIICFAAAGIALAGHGYREQLGEFAVVREAAPGRSNCLLYGKIISVSVQVRGRYSFVVFSDSLVAFTKQAFLRKKTIQCSSLNTPPSYGRVVMKGTYRTPRPAENPGAFDDYLYCLSNNIWGRFYCDSIAAIPSDVSPWQYLTSRVRETVVSASGSIRNSDYRAIIVASFLNDKSDISDDVMNLFFRAGIFHLIALSGFNIAIIAGALFAFLSLLPLKKEIKITLVIIFIWGYLLFIGPIPSLFRAVVMTSVFFISFLFQKKPYVLNSLGLAGIIWLCLSPLSLFTPSYQLSFAATFGIVTLYPVLSGRLRPKTGHSLVSRFFLAPFFSALYVSVAAFITTAPVLIHHFGNVSVAGIIANLFAVALMSVAMWFSMIGFMFQIVSAPAAWLCMRCAELFVAAMIAGSNIVASLPLATVQVPRMHWLWYVLAAVYIAGLCVFRKEILIRYLLWATPACMVLSLGLILVTEKNINAQIVSFKIDKSSVFGVQWPNGKKWLIGTGPEGARYSTFSRVIHPWTRQSWNQNIGAVILRGDPCYATQSLEPLLEKAHTKKIYCSETTAGGCPDFLSFLREYHADFTKLGPNDTLLPAPACTCTVLPGIGDSGRVPCRYKIAMYNSSVVLPDTAFSPTEHGGAVIITCPKNHVLSVRTMVSPLHPLFADTPSPRPAGKRL
jgi:ComEC/Rec2-related protein